GGGGRGVVSGLPGGVAGPPAGRVQVGALPLARRHRSARRAEGAGRGGAGRPRGARLGQHRRDPIHGAARAAEGHRGHERGAAGRARDARRDDRRGDGDAMNGAHHLGGMHGFGAREVERDEPVFHGEWERRTFAITLATGFLGKWNLDMSRYAREQMPPAEYLATTYYEHWLFGLEKLLDQHGLVRHEELEARLRDAA